MATLTVNGTSQDIDADGDTPLLWVLRDHLSLTGTKYGCGMALCGACTVHVDGVATRSCVLPLKAVEGKRVATIEGGPHGLIWTHSETVNRELLAFLKSGETKRAVA